MEIRESVRVAFNELIFPEIEKIQQSNQENALRLEAVNQRLDDVNNRLNDMNAHLVDQSRRIDQTNERIEAMSVNFQTRMDRLYEVIVRRDEHNKLEERVVALERDLSELKRHVAA